MIVLCERGGLLRGGLMMGFGERGGLIVGGLMRFC